MLRVLLVGHGLIGKQRARALVSLAARGAPCSLAGTVDPSPRPSDLYGSAPHFASVGDVPAGSFDAAVLALPHHLTRPVALEVLARRCPVLVEKPLGLDAREAAEIASAAAGLPCFVGYNYRFLPHVAAAAARVRSGALGELRSIDMFLGHGGNPRSAEEWKLDPALAGGGVLIDPGVHLIDLLLRFAPGVELRHVSGSRGFWPTGIEEDVVGVFGEAPLLATLRVSHIRWVNTFRIELGGVDGYAILEGRGGAYGALTARFGRRWAWNDGSGRSQRQTEESQDFGSDNRSLEDELAAVVALWTGTTLPESVASPATFAEALRVSEVCDAAYEALRSGELK